ncbi:MAG TPA: nucleotidyltransferase domain-containing protein [Dehalococcoidia bacterium]|nr:nucleotidyltransferase domain-containing protein [Dehalococcoidia bacterium]
MDAVADGMEQQALDEAVRRLVETLKPERNYLFGSQARGDADEYSDYDLMVIVRESDRPRYEREQDAYGALWEVPIPAEVLVWTHDEFERQFERQRERDSVTPGRGRGRDELRPYGNGR